MMKKVYVGMLLILLLTSVCLGACGKGETPAAETESQPSVMSVPPTETQTPQTTVVSTPETETQTPQTAVTPMRETETEPAQTLESLLGEDYVQFLTDTITMQMENRMEKNPEVRYYPIVDQAPLGDYAAIGESTQFEVDAQGCLVIVFPAGTVAAPEHGEQRFLVIRVASAD